MAQVPKSFQDTLRELFELLKAYAQQETVGPLKHLGRRIGLGIAGSLLFASGWFFLTLGVLRVLQTHVTFFDDRDWLAYFIAVALLLFAVGGALRKIKQPDPGLATPGMATSASTSSDRNTR